MKKIVWIVLFLATSTFAELQQVWATPAFADKNITIIDIRTPNEWKKTGIIKGSHTIMFFDEQGNFSVPDFVAKIDKIVTKEEPFALICRVGSRTGMVSEFLSQKLGYRVINLKGGIMKMIYEGYKTVPYQK